jgi:hypothetical protein
MNFNNHEIVPYKNGLTYEENAIIKSKWRAYIQIVGLETSEDPLKCPRVGRNDRIAVYEAVKDQIQQVIDETLQNGNGKINLLVIEKKSSVIIRKAQRELLRKGNCPEED